MASMNREVRHMQEMPPNLTGWWALSPQPEGTHTPLLLKAHLEPPPAQSSTLRARALTAPMPIPSAGIALPQMCPECQPRAEPFNEPSLCAVIYAKHGNGPWGGDATLTQRAKHYIEFKARRIIYRSVPAKEYKHLCTSQFITLIFHSLGLL